MRSFISLGITCVLALAATQGCANRIGHARLYSLERAERLEMSLHFTGSRNGPAYATYPDGESLEGEFIVWTTRKGHIDASAWQSIETQVKSLSTGEAADSWPEVYGFGTESPAEPVGTAMLIGNRGTSLEVVLYHVETEYSVSGDGLARDNRGNWFRVMIGDLPEN